MKVLVNCYACSPYQGSEPGMGWNFVKGLSAYHELHVLTESKFEPHLRRYMDEHPDELHSVHFHFISKERHKTLRKIWPPSYYWYYNKWQRKALALAKELDAKLDFDVVHQLNMVGYREPGYLYELGKPLVWGPMGGFNITPWRLLPSMGLKGCLFYMMRNLINLWQMNHSSQVKDAVCHSDGIIAATQEDHDTVLRLWNKESVLIPEVGFQPSGNFENRVRKGTLKVCWSGIHTPRKALNLLLDALSMVDNLSNVELHVIGAGECTRAWKRKACKLGLNNVIWHGWLEKAGAVKVMSHCDVFVITSLSDATSTVLLEALSMGLPVIATNHLGFANVLTDACGIRIDINSKKQVVRDFAAAIVRIEGDEAYRQQLSRGAFERAKDFSWGAKIEKINTIYNSVIAKHQK